MKKLLIAMLALSLGFSVMAAKKGAMDAKVDKMDQWTAMDIGFWFGFPSTMDETNVRGWRVGFPISYGKGYVRGLESALFCAATDDIDGVQAAIGVCMTKSVYGAQFALVNIACDEVRGAQFGLVNHSGARGWQFGLINCADNAQFQAGLLCMNKNGLLPFSFLLNFGRDTFKSSEEIQSEVKMCKKCKMAMPNCKCKCKKCKMPMPKCKCKKMK